MFQGRVIFLDEVTRDNRGLYKCMAVNEAGKDERKVRLTVRCRYFSLVTVVVVVLETVLSE